MLRNVTSWPARSNSICKLRTPCKAQYFSPRDTPLGGDIGIHGEGARWAGDSERFDWTNGCIAVSDADVDFLKSRIRLGVPVELHP